jgi:hypothetical protein
MPYGHKLTSGITLNDYSYLDKKYTFMFINFWYNIDHDIIFSRRRQILK